MEWISVNDTQPDASKCVLVTDGKLMASAWHINSIWYPMHFMFEIHCNLKCNSGYTISFNTKITHWMPLPDPTGDYDRIKIEDLILSTRTFNRLRNAGIETVGELRQKTANEILKIRGFGRRSLREVKHVLESLGYKPTEENPYLKAFYGKSTEGL